MAYKFDKFSKRARLAFGLAQEEAQRFNHNYIGTEHLLLGLVRQQDSVAGRVLANLEVQTEGVRNAVEAIIGLGHHNVIGDIGLTPRAKKVFAFSVDEARRLNHHYVGTEHILLGIVREGESIAAGVLESLGVNLARVRSEVVRVLSDDRLQARGHVVDQGFPGMPPGVPNSDALLRSAIEAVRAARDAALAEQNYLRASDLRDIEGTLEQMLDA